MGVAGSCVESDAGLDLAAKRAYMIRRVALVVTFADVLRRAWRAVLIFEYRAGPWGPPDFILGVHDQAASGSNASIQRDEL
jgi:hypothetical protein